VIDFSQNGEFINMALLNRHCFGEGGSFKKLAMIFFG
jgi:hypothetical protein